VAGTSLHFSDSVKLLDVELDQAFSVDRHVSSALPTAPVAGGSGGPARTSAT